MAKKKPKFEPKPVPIVELLEQAIVKLIDEFPGLADLAEEVWCETIIEALDAIKFGKQTRLYELQDEAENPDPDDDAPE